MKSSTMLQELKNARRNETILPASILAFFAAHGNFAVREYIGSLLSDHSPVVGQLPPDFRLDFWLLFVRESFGRVEGYEFTETVLCFLWECNYARNVKSRQMRLQQLITLLEELYGEPLEQRLLILTDDLVRLFPEVIDRRQYSYSSSFAQFIAESVKVYAPQWGQR